jgi:transposase
VQLLAERSVETSKVWLRKHPEIDLVSRDRGKIFREAATDGAPQAKQVVDRFHLQKNFAEALEKFFRKQEQALKTATQRSAGRTGSASQAKAVLATWIIRSKISTSRRRKIVIPCLQTQAGRCRIRRRR